MTQDHLREVIAALDRLASDPRTPSGEAETAKAKATILRAKLKAGPAEWQKHPESFSDLFLGALRQNAERRGFKFSLHYRWDGRRYVPCADRRLVKGVPCAAHCPHYADRLPCCGCEEIPGELEIEG